jgi:hypothetical protein
MVLFQNRNTSVGTARDMILDIISFLKKFGTISDNFKDFSWRGDFQFLMIFQG